jgi:hypothetical protein
MSKMSQYIYDLQERCGFQEDENGNVIINWKVCKEDLEKRLHPTEKLEVEEFEKDMKS